MMKMEKCRPGKSRIWIFKSWICQLYLNLAIFYYYNSTFAVLIQFSVWNIIEGIKRSVSLQTNRQTDKHTDAIKMGEPPGIKNYHSGGKIRYNTPLRVGRKKTSAQLSQNIENSHFWSNASKPLESVQVSFLWCSLNTPHLEFLKSLFNLLNSSQTTIKISKNYSARPFSWIQPK